MFSKIKALPIPLKFLSWWCLIAASVSAILAALVVFQGFLGAQVAFLAVDIAFPLLLVVGIIQRSRFIRGLMLAFAWIGAVLLALSIAALLLPSAASPPLSGFLQLASCILMICCLSAHESKLYFDPGSGGTLKGTSG
jgi:hypothetical protein